MRFLFTTRRGQETSFIKAEDYDHALSIAQQYRFNEIVDIEGKPVSREHYSSEDILPTQQIAFAYNTIKRGGEIDQEGIEHIARSLSKLIHYVSNLKEILDNDVLQGIQIYRNYLPNDDEFPDFFKWVAEMQALVEERFITRNEYLGIEEEDDDLTMDFE